MANVFKVPIKNIYYMLCYAWNVSDYSDSTVCGDEEFDDIYNLLARILLKELGILLKRGFYKEYVEKTEIMSNLKGQININDSVQKNTLENMKMICTYDEYSENVLFNQIIKATLIDFLKYSGLAKELQNQIRKILLAFNNIDIIKVEKKHFSMLKFHRNNLNYLVIMNVCKLFKCGLIANENDSSIKFANYISDNQMQKVYEIFILNFYKKHLDKSIYKVHAPKIKWHLDSNATDEWRGLFDIEDNPGDRRTDIVIENKIKNIQFIIDAKYYKETLVSKYYNDNELTYRTLHLNQVRGYLLDSDFQGKKIGALMYPTLNVDLEKGKIIPISGNPIIIKTLNLNTKWENIKNDLLTFVQKVL